MSKKTRLIILGIFVFIFLAVSLPLIFYARGYRIDWKNKVLIQTGAFFLKSYPQAAKVFLNGKKEPEQTPVFIKGLLPGEYELEIRKEGFYNWKKNLRIEPALVTEVSNIVLLPKNPLEELVIDKKIEEFIFSPDEEKIIFTTLEEESAGIWLYDLSQKKEIYLLNPSALGLPSHQTYENIRWSHDSQKILFSLNENHWFIIELSGTPSLIALRPEFAFWSVKAETLSSLRNSRQFLFQNALWHPLNSEIIFFKEGNSLYSLNYLDKKITGPIAENINSFVLSRSGLFYLSAPNNILYKIALKERRLEEIKVQLTTAPLSLNADSQIIISPREKNIFLEEGKNVYFLDQERKSFEFLQDKIDKIKFSQGADKVLAFSPHEIWIWYLKDSLYQPFHKKGEKELITRLNQKIEDVILYNETGEHLIFTLPEAINFIELDYRDGRNTIEFLTAKNSLVYYSQSEKKLYFTNEKKLFWTRLIEK